MTRSGSKYAVMALAVLLGLEGAARLAPAPARDGVADLVRSAHAGPDHEPLGPLLWRLVPGTSLKDGGVVSAAGFRGPDPRSPRVLVLGDQVVFGQGVDERASWPRLLDRDGHEVLAAGLPGYTTHQGRQLLELLLRRYQPEVVVLGFGLEDARAFPMRDSRAAKVPAGGRSALVDRVTWMLGDGRRLRQVKRLAELEGWLRELFPARDEEVQAELEEVHGEVRRILERAGARVPLEEYEENLRAMSRAAREYGAKVVFLGPVFRAPSLEPELADSRLARPVSEYREAMHRVAREENLRFVKLPVLNEGGSGPKKLYQRRRLSEAERATFRRMSAEERAGRGLSIDLRVRTDLALPAPAGHALIARALADLVGDGATAQVLPRAE